MGDHNYVNNWPDHSKLLLSATHLERERVIEREEEEEKQFETGHKWRRERRTREDKRAGKEGLSD